MKVLLLTNKTDAGGGWKQIPYSSGFLEIKSEEVPSTPLCKKVGR